MLILITGKPGMGKTLNMTYIAYQNFKQKNPPFKVWFTEHILRKKYIYNLSEYSDYPIIFKRPKKNKLYYFYDEKGEIKSSPFLCSLKFRIFDLHLDNKFIDGANFYIDEIQQKYDSMEYKDFPDCIAHYCQAHRHFDNNIYINSQSQSRVIKRLLVLAEEYRDIREFKIYFGRLARIRVRRTWDMSANLENGIMTDNIADVDYYQKFFRIRKYGKMYDSKYLRFLQKNSKKYQSIMFDSLQLDKDTLLNSFFPTIDERKQLHDKRY